MHPAEYAVTELPQIFSALHEKHIFELSILNSSVFPPSAAVSSHFAAVLRLRMAKP